MTEVLLQGGPAHGATIESRTGAPMIVEGHGVPDGYVARYRPMDGRKRDNTTFRFDGLTKVVGRLPLPRARMDARSVIPMEGTEVEAVT